MNHTTKPLDYTRATQLFDLSLAAEQRVRGSIREAMRKTGLGDVVSASTGVLEAIASGERVWLTSDLHLGHRNILKYGQRHHRDLDHMNQDILDRLRRNVRPDETLIVAGDLMFGDHPELLEALSGVSERVILVVGNHDFTSGGNFKFPKHHFAAVVPFLFWHWEGQDCLVTHFPVPTSMPVSVPASLPEGIRFDTALPPGGPMLVNYHGHLHLETVASDHARVDHVNVCYDNLRGMLCL